MSKHTPGPWTVQAGGLADEGIRWVINGAGDAICRVQSRPLSGWKANAKLIAAAPDLLRALRDLVMDVHDLSDIDTTLDSYQTARDLLSKLGGLIP